MQSTDIRKIKQAISDQAMRGRRQVWVEDHQRVIDVKTVKGQLKARILRGQWVDVNAVYID